MTTNVFEEYLEDHPTPWAIELEVINPIYGLYVEYIIDKNKVRVTRIDPDYRYDAKMIVGIVNAKSN